MPKRKVVQIAVSYTRIPPYTADDYFQHVFALCDDGSVWQHTLDVPGPLRDDVHDFANVTRPSPPAILRSRTAVLLGAHLLEQHMKRREKHRPRNL